MSLTCIQRFSVWSNGYAILPTILECDGKGDCYSQFTVEQGALLQLQRAIPSNGVKC